jgi:ankyrin repeat protein
MALIDRGRIDAKNNDGETALHMCLRTGHTEIAMLLMNGADRLNTTGLDAHSYKVYEEALAACGGGGICNGFNTQKKNPLGQQ